MDMSNYPGGAVLYLDMPYSQDNTNPDIYKFIVKYFIANGGNILDINTMNVETLQDARVHPEDHKNLVVRVWGFSAYYVTLDEDTQDEMIKRMLKV